MCGPVQLWHVSATLPAGPTCVALGARLLDPLALLLAEELTLAVCAQNKVSDWKE